LVSVSESLREELCSAYGIRRTRMDVVYTCVDLALLKKLTYNRYSVQPRKINLLYAGRLYYGKGIMHLLTIMKLLARDLGQTNFHLQIFGRGPLEETLRRYIFLNDLQKLVTFRGYVPHDSLLKNLADSDILCFPSLYEACPLLMIEAMGLGKPVVAYDLPFAREMLGRNCSMLLASDNTDFARKLSRLMSCDDDRRKIGEILESRASNYDATKIALLYDKIYAGLLG
jgi:glycosyltransferase involved in cell wall biosynthesis